MKNVNPQRNMCIEQAERVVDVREKINKLLTISERILRWMKLTVFAVLLLSTQAVQC